MLWVAVFGTFARDGFGYNGKPDTETDGRLRREDAYVLTPSRPYRELAALAARNGRSRI